MSKIEDASIHVLTFKDGLLARLAHDLRLELGRHDISVDGDKISAIFWPETLTVAGTIADSRLNPSGLSTKDSRDVIDNLQRKILDIRKFVIITFEGKLDSQSETAITASGTLTIKGKGQEIRLDAKRNAGRIQGEVTLVPTRWGIKPFKAALGAIKLQDRLTVGFDLADPA